MPSAAAHSTGPLSPGQAFGTRYHIIRLLGIGGMGAVYHAWDAELGVALALKVIRPEVAAEPGASRDLERRFKRELLLARQVTHKNVVRIHDLGEIDGIKYITMPYVQGSDLARVIAHGRLPLPEALRIARQIVAGLQAAHDVGVVHRDLKPANIMIDEDGHAVIMDFGIARSIGAPQGQTVAGAVVGTLEYMAPEQARAQPVDHRADIYAFGLIFYDMLMGPRRSASAQSAVAELMGRMQAAPPSLRLLEPQIPEPVDRLIAHCLEPETSDRYQTTDALAADLDLLDATGYMRVASPSATGSATVSSLNLASSASIPQDPSSAFRTATLTTPVPQPAGRRLPRVFSKWAAVAGMLVVLAVTAVLWRGRSDNRAASPPAAGAEPVSLAILPFRNASGDAALDRLGASLAEILSTEIGQSAYLRTIRSDRLHQVLRDLHVSPDSSLDPDTLRRLAEFSNAQTVMWGQYLKFGNEIRIDVTLQDLRQQRTIALKAEAPSERALLSAVDDLARLVRENLAASPDILKSLQAQSLKPSSKSFDALRYYNEGLELARQGNHLEAVKRFKASTEEDPNFALAYSKLGQAYATLGYDTEAEQSSRQAVDLTERLPLQEKYLVLANYAKIRHDTAKAIESYQNLTKVAPEDPGIHFELAALYESTGSLDRAREQYAQVLQRDPKYVDALLAMGRVEINRSNPQGALEYLNRGLGLAIQLDNAEAKANLLNAIGVTYKRLDKPDEALRYYRESLDLRRGLGQKGGIAASLSEIAQVQERLGKPAEALKSYDEALRLQREIGDKRGLGYTLIDVGALESEQGHTVAALKLLKESLQIQREVGDETYQALCLNNIGTVYFSDGQYEDAVLYFERALQLREKAGIPGEIAETVHNLAETSLKRGQYDQALTQYLRALDLRRTAGDKREAAIESYSIGTIFQYQGRYGAALKSKEEALKSFRSVQERGFWLGEMLSGYGNALSQVGRTKDAGQALDEALTVAREASNLPLEAQILNFRGEDALYRRDFRAARTLFEQALKIALQTRDPHLVLVSRVNLAKVAVADRRGASALPALSALGQEADEMGLKYLSVECSVARAEALLGTRDYLKARQEVERAVGRSENLGLRTLLARSHFLLATALRPLHQEADARRHFAQARAIVEEIRKEAGSDAVLSRSDLNPIVADAAGAS